MEHRPASLISLADVETAIPSAVAALDSSLYQVRIQRASPSERRYLRAMAELGDGPYRSGDVAKALGKPTSAFSSLRQDLIDKGLIYATADYGHIDFSVPRFAEFMCRYMDHAAD